MAELQSLDLTPDRMNDALRRAGLSDRYKVTQRISGSAFGWYDTTVWRTNRGGKLIVTVTMDANERVPRLLSVLRVKNPRRRAATLPGGGPGTNTESVADWSLDCNGPSI